MKKAVLIFCSCLLISWLAKGQDQSEIFINDSLIGEFLSEYQLEARHRGIDVKPHMDSINYIFIEPVNEHKYHMNKSGLAVYIKDVNMILLSRNCLIDRCILKATLFREIHHSLGVPYEETGYKIMSLKKPKGYSYAWIDDPFITEIEYDEFFGRLKMYLN